MKKKILMVSDFSSYEIPGGAEFSDFEIIKEFDCDFVKSSMFTSGEGYDKIILSNHWRLTQEGREWLIEHGYDAVACHDFSIFPNRVPPPGLIADPAILLNVELLQAAKTVIFQSNLQRQIFEKNVKLNSTYTLGGNLWSDSQLSFFEGVSGEKNGRCAILRGSAASKGFDKSVEIAKHLRIPFDILENMPYADFINQLSKFSSVILSPGIIESFGRVACEARMMNLTVLTNEMMACSHEGFWNKNRYEIIDEMRKCKKQLFEVLDTIPLSIEKS